MPIDKSYESAAAAVADIADGATVMVGGFGGAGSPLTLLAALTARSPRGLTVVSNNAGSGHDGIAALLAAGCAARIVCSFPRMAGSVVFNDLYERGELELELCPQGTLIERIRAGGAGIGGFYTRTGVGTDLARGVEHRMIDGVDHLFQLPLRADYALLAAARADRWGNLVYSKAARNFGPAMATAAAVTVVEVDEIVPLGSLDPEQVVTPGVCVRRLVDLRTERAHG